MKCFIEHEKDAFSYYKWFCKNEAIRILGYIPSLSVFSINGTMIFTQDDRRLFIESCSNEIIKLFSKEPLGDKYKLYLIANVEVKDKNSKIEKHRKVWKLIQTEWQLDGFKLGPEIEINKNDSRYYTSLAVLEKESIQKSIEMISKYPKRFTVIASNRSDVLSEDCIRGIFDMSYRYDTKHSEIDYFMLSLGLCQEGDIVFRWGDASEEAEIDMIFKADMSYLFVK